jgi:uncharacterized protein YegP (UPF0339 family)
MTSGTRGVLDGLSTDLEPAAGRSVRGYWVVLAGLTLGAVGVLGSLSVGVTDLGAALGAVGLATVVAGSVRTLGLGPPSERAASAGLALSVTAVAWVALAPGPVRPPTRTAVAVYGTGLGVAALGGVVAPLLVDRDPEVDREVDVDALRQERDRLEADLERARNELAAGASVRSRQSATIEALRRSRAQFELDGDDHRVRLRASDGTVLAEGGTHESVRAARRTVEAVRRSALGAAVVELPVAGDRERVPPGPGASDATFALSVDDDGGVRWRLQTAEGDPLVESAGSTDRRTATRTIERVRATAGPATYLSVEPAVVQLFRDGDQWRWRLVGPEGVLAVGEDGAAHVDAAERAVDTARGAVEAGAASVVEDAAGDYRFRLHGSGGASAVRAPEGLPTEAAARAALSTVRERLPDAETMPVGPGAFELFPEGGGHRFRLRASDGTVLAESVATYPDRAAAEAAVGRVKLLAAGATVDDEG